MKRSTALPLALICATALSGASAFASAARAESVPPPSITVSGEATLSVVPDRAEIDGGVTSEAKTAREAADANNKAMANVLAALKAAGIADNDIQTSRLSLQPQSSASRNGNGPLQITGYRASNRVMLTLRDVTKVAGAIDSLVGAGANEISGISFSVSQASKLMDDARGRAIADARRKAEIYAKAANVSLGEPLSISEDGAPGPVPMYARKMAADVAATPVAPGSETLRISVSVSYAIKP
ncbi:SIMPL domain-containing protein [Bradyrhizobium sp. U87765 SZCCT0131]|uniref:SIMPL domain-containing protein n=1 Tax=unclassified Bradyrhizobium TaxID=2631580 RepID=UPI001BADF6E2|nr:MULTISPECIES: SIMPL domain-containing protein [unclassified Bradyrhizobium]MBR1216989.1 SIMPL domain-containing protein [Bradyrhizobium sp. U87765 SZCCT0131]MBR1259255.1 SIMPL domain-containing protein [Bradyrhizobium sp. U87765 SZCCT0134]MBR1305396.1 SIMPL domain-containing protein [Bradyrhizobium sp. U87765 SZCCT0110]MBR1321182.1 SIMPL domain-containing protein [Bradyrhizobium sp. U87765 SZCCT0109]MBR1350164.1 SIMPL domain-containing protein [Bradyrhizobium sp. U87765 SZCCT0048]